MLGGFVWEVLMLTRRRFAAFSAATAAALALPLRMRGAATRSGLDFGLVLYTVRKEIKTAADLPRLLGLIHEIGYASIEVFQQVYDHPAAELKQLIESHGLKAPSGHFDYATIGDKVDYAKTLGLKYMVCPAIPRDMWDTADGFKKAAAHLNEASTKISAAGMKLGYHAHNYEYKPLPGGGTGFEILMKELDPAVRLELDIYWATQAGQDPLKLMRENRNRLALIHIKDRKADVPTGFMPGAAGAHFTEIGSGTINWKAVIGEAHRLGVHEMFVEQDTQEIPVEESIRKSFDYLKNLAI